MPPPSGASTSAQERDEVLVFVGGEVGAADDHDEQSDTIGRCRLRLRDRGVEHAKLFPFLALLHALGELGLLIALREGLIELARTIVVTRELLELLFPPRHVLNPGLIGRDSVA